MECEKCGGQGFLYSPERDGSSEKVKCHVCGGNGEQFAMNTGDGFYDWLMENLLDSVSNVGDFALDDDKSPEKVLVGREQIIRMNIFKEALDRYQAK